VTQENLSPILTRLCLKEKNTEEGMFLDLSGYIPVANKLHKNIKEVGSEKELEQYADVIAENWVPPDVNVRPYYRKVASQILNPA
jgi:hypothetical protein